MRRHKILGDYREQATALFCSEMRTCSRDADVSNLDAPALSFPGSRRRTPGRLTREQWQPSTPISTGKRVDDLRGNKSHQLKPNCSKSITVRSDSLFCCSLQHLTRNLKKQSIENCS